MTGKFAQNELDRKVTVFFFLSLIPWKPRLRSNTWDEVVFAVGGGYLLFAESVVNGKADITNVSTWMWFIRVTHCLSRARSRTSLLLLKTSWRPSSWLWGCCCSPSAAVTPCVSDLCLLLPSLVCWHQLYILSLIFAAKATHYSTSPGSCCFQFSNFSISPKLVSDITRTHSSCLNRAFMWAWPSIYLYLSYWSGI